MTVKQLKDIIRQIIIADMEKKQLINIIRQVIAENLEKNGNNLDEERIANPDAKEFVKKRQNFIGSHIFGEDIGNLGKMYVAYSYGEQFPLYLYYNNKWYHNTDNYLLDDDTINPATEKHREDMMPTAETIGVPTRALQSVISNFKKQQGIEEIGHKSVEPGEKN